MRTSNAGIALIKSFEGFRPRAVPLGNGGWTIGYGHTRSAREGLKITRAEAEAVLQEYDLPPIELFIRRSILSPINQNEFDALVSFAFNLGLDTFRTCDVLETFNSGDHLETAELMGDWRMASINGRLVVVDALVRRRAAERALFLEHPGGRPIAPSPVIRPVRGNLSRHDLSDADITDHAPAPNHREVDAEPPEAELSSPEAAAKAVTERLTRILGEGREQTPAERADPGDLPDRIEGPTEDEVRKAVSVLAGIEPVERDREELEPVESASLWPPLESDGIEIEPDADPDDLPPVETALDQDRPARGQSEPPVIDDLEPPRLDPETERAARAAINGNKDEAGPSGNFSWAPFAVLAVAGGALAGWGLSDMLSSGGRFATTGEHGGAIAVLVGLLLLAVMGYYGVRHLFGSNSKS